MGKHEDQIESMRSRLGVLLYQWRSEIQKRSDAEAEIKRLDGEIAKLDYGLNAANAVACAAIAEVQETHRKQIEAMEQTNQRPAKAARKDKAK